MNKPVVGRGLSLIIKISLIVAMDEKTQESKQIPTGVVGGINIAGTDRWTDRQTNE